MRLRRPLASGLTAAALAAGATGVVPAAAVEGLPAAAQPPICSAPNGQGFPIETRIKGGPPGYEAGGGYRSWAVELANTTRGSCGNIHPVVVIVDDERELKPRQIQLEFHDGTRWRPVEFERTDRDENVGVFDDGFPGFKVKAGQTRTVKVRLSFTSGAHSEHSVISAAIVQRRDDDGDWVGESSDYPFAIDGGRGSDSGSDSDSDSDTGTGARGDSDVGTDPDGRRDERDGPGIDGGSGGAGERSDHGDSSYADELAATGPRALLGVGAIAGALFAGGWALVVGTRRLRAARRR